MERGYEHRTVSKRARVKTGLRAEMVLCHFCLEVHRAILKSSHFNMKGFVTCFPDCLPMDLDDPRFLLCSLELIGFNRFSIFECHALFGIEAQTTNTWFQINRQCQHKNYESISAKNIYIETNFFSKRRQQKF